ncbi:unnamed protein product [Heligmosomoides polygyrus]|uniref:SER_THR_PHOSPHATASE domain-containing protein n=1 Tax=Heligmosomoides polygyrus TaxID=6339 RepID=A0A3P8B6G4_HELPZ|nr:unnamed protein product [Heligmosomoides polygyrus]
MKLFKDRLICAKRKSRSGKFHYKTCNRFPKAKIFPFCVYIVQPARRSQAAQFYYDCMYAEDLPQKCIQHEEHYFPSITVKLRGRTITGALMCCMDDYCNEVEDPVFTEINKYFTISPNFSSLRRLHDTLRHFNQAYKFPVNETIEDQEANMFLEVHVTQEDANVTRKVKRKVQTKLSSLAMKMVEHGPYEFDFDPTEIGDLFDSVSQLLAREPSLLQLASDVWIYGNLDGHYSTVYRWLHSNGWPPKRKVLFLGGYTSDDNYYSLETITLLFALKGRFSRRVTRCLEGVIQRACGYLPLAATVADTILCCHGGITSKMTKLSDITDIRRPIHHVRKGSIAADLIFSVVSKNSGLIPGARGRRFNPMCDETELVLRSLGMEMLIRSRNPVKQGYQSFGARTLSIWSAPGEANCKAGAAIHVNCSKVLTIVKMGEYGTFTKEQVANAGTQLDKADAQLPMNKDRERRKKKARKEGTKKGTPSPNRST